MQRARSMQQDKPGEGVKHERLGAESVGSGGADEGWLDQLLAAGNLDPPASMSHEPLLAPALTMVRQLRDIELSRAFSVL
jgi:hypothetical protein